MKPSLFFRIASVLLLLFAIGHTLGFRSPDPQWGVDSLVTSMHSIHFNVQGFDRTFWDLYTAAGFYVGVFLLFSAILAWQLGSLAPQNLAPLRLTAWAFALVFVVLTILSSRYLFAIPVVFCSLIALCLILAAGLSHKQSS